MFPRHRRSFTLLELIVVVVIMGVLAGLALPTWVSVVQRYKTESSDSSALGIVMQEAYLAGRLDGLAVPTSGLVQEVIDEIPLTSGLPLPGARVCDVAAPVPDPDCGGPGVVVPYLLRSSAGLEVAAVALTGEHCVLAYAQEGGSYSSWRSDGAQGGCHALRAVPGPLEAAVPAPPPLAPGLPGYATATLVSDGDTAVLETSTTFATVTMQPTTGAATVRAVPLDGSGNQLPGTGCGAVARAVVSGAGVAANCAGDLLSGGPDTDAAAICWTDCQVTLSSATPFRVTVVRLHDALGGGAFSAQSATP